MPSFVDTNVLVYAEDRDAGAKHEVARDLLLGLWDSADGVLSVQVLQEFYVNVTRKLRKPMSPLAALTAVREYFAWTVIENSASLLARGIELQQKAKLSFWDALVVQAALDARCETLFSEDLNAGQRFGSLQIVNPFTPRKR